MRAQWGGYPVDGAIPLDRPEILAALDRGEVEELYLDAKVMGEGGVLLEDVRELLGTAVEKLPPGGAVCMTRLDPAWGAERFLRPLLALGFVAPILQRTAPRELNLTVYRDDGVRPTTPLLPAPGAPADTLLVLPTVVERLDAAIACLRQRAEAATVPVETLVVLDGGTDRDVERLRAVVGAENRIDYSPTRRGLVEAYNVGYRTVLAEPRFAYLHMIEDGLVFGSGYDLALRRILRAHPGYGWTANGQANNPNAPFTSLCSMMTRECVEAVRGLDPEFAPCQFDDGDLYMRCRVAGFFPTASAFLVLHPEGRTSVPAGERPADYDLMLAHQRKFAARWKLPDFYWAQVAVHTEQHCPRCLAD